MDDKIVLVYERIDSGRSLYSLVGIIIPRRVFSRELPCSPHEEVEIALYDPIYSKEEEKKLKKLKENPEFIPLDC